MVGAAFAVEVVSVEALGAWHSPVSVDLVGNLLGDTVESFPILIINKSRIKSKDA